MAWEDIMCTVCCKHRAQKLCKRCPAPAKFCLMCWANTHAKLDHGEAKTLCVDCFSEPAAVECESCTGKICKKCIAAHMLACEGSSDDDGSIGEDEKNIDSPGDSPMSCAGDSEPREKRAMPAAIKSGLEPGAPPAKKRKGASKPPAKKRAPKEPKKVAEVVEDKAKAPANRPEVDEGIMSRIKKALALGLHCGGNEAEKKHAMQRATKLLQKHGLTQADVENMSDGGVEAASGMTKVRLNGLHTQWPAWGRTVGHVAAVMCNAKWFMSKGTVGGACYSVTFYGLRADSAMAAAIFEVGYNSVLHLSQQEMKGKGARAMLDYRQGMVSGLYKIAWADKEEREKALEAARAAAATQAAVATGKGSGGAKEEVTPVLGQRCSVAAVKAEVKPEPDVPAEDPLDDDGKPWAKVKPEGGGASAKVKLERRGGRGGWDSDSDSFADYGRDDYDDVGSDDDWQDFGGRAGKENGLTLPAKAGAAVSKAVGAGGQKSGSAKAAGGDNMQQLVLYDDKAKLAFQAVESKMRIKKGKKGKATQIKDYAAYRQGKESASKVSLGVKALTAGGAS